MLSRRESGGRLLPVGVIGVRGSFASGQAVRILIRCFTDGTTIDKGETSPSQSCDMQENASVLSRSSSSSSLLDDLESDAHTIVDDDTGHTVEESDSWEIKEVGRGLANYNSVQISRVKGLNRHVLFMAVAFRIH